MVDTSKIQKAIQKDRRKQSDHGIKIDNVF